jgi:hypothetical protein
MEHCFIMRIIELEHVAEVAVTERCDVAGTAGPPINLRFSVTAALDQHIAAMPACPSPRDPRPQRRCSPSSSRFKVC